MRLTTKQQVLNRLRSGNSMSTDDLSNVDLDGMDFHNRYLADANFRGSILSHTNFRNSIVAHACFRYANLTSADFQSASVRYTDFYLTTLDKVDFRGAHLPAPTVILLAEWMDISDQLTADLMVWDSLNHPNPKAFRNWAKGGSCPYNNVHVERAARFSEKRSLWGKGKRRTPYELMMALFKEKKIKFNG